MNKKLATALIALLCICTMVFAAISVDQADQLYDADQFTQTEKLLLAELSKAANAKEEAEVLWRLARVMVSLGDDLDEKDKDGRFAYYERGEEYANQSIAKNPTPFGYLWRASNMGRWGQTKGPLNALGKAKLMLADLTVIINDFKTLDSSETWYVISSLYDEVPGGISFGNKEWAVSYMRIAMETIPKNLLYPGHYKKLAEELYARNWNASKRTREMEKMQKEWQKGNTNLEKYRYYEGKDGGATIPFYSSVALSKMSDRQEAVMVLSYILDKAKVFPSVKNSDMKDLQEIEKMRNSWI